MSQQSWDAPWPYGYPDSVDSAGAVASPLLAGFSFSLIALTIPGDGIKWPAISQTLFVASGFLFILAIQAGFWARQWAIRPSDVTEWRPNDSAKRQHAEQRLHQRGFRIWAGRVRWTYRFGLLTLLAGVVFMLVPSGRIDWTHWFAIAAASSAWLLETLWILSGWILRGSPVSLYTGQNDVPKPGTRFIGVRSLGPLRRLARKVEPLVSVDP